MSTMTMQDEPLAEVYEPSEPLSMVDGMLKTYWWKVAYYHLQKYLPEQYAALKKAGTLEATLDKRLQAFDELTDSLTDSGYRLEEAMEVAFPQYIYLPPEPGAG